MAETPGQKLRRLRDARGITRQKVARDLDISERTVIRHEDGTTPLSPFHRRVYADYYGIKPETLGAPRRSRTAA